MKHDHPDKIIFLDIDGVLNTSRHRYMKFDEEAMKNLEDILDATGAKIVVSSSWRSSREIMIPLFSGHGCTQKIINAIIGITVRGYDYVKPKSDLPIVRGNEIKEWIDRHLKFPWHADPSCDIKYRTFREDGSFRMMDHNENGKDYSYLILDYDTDMLYEQRNNFINTNALDGITKEHVEQAIKILNYGPNTQKDQNQFSC